MFCCTQQRTCERRVASKCAAHCARVCCRERVADARVWTLTSCRFVSNCAVSARQWLKGKADENDTRHGQAAATRGVRVIVCVVGKAVLHVPSVRKASMLGYLARVRTDSWMLYFPLFFWIVWRGVFAPTPSAAHTEARARVRFNRAATMQSAWVIPEPHRAPLEGMHRRIHADQSRDARARNVVADSACRV